MLRQLQGLPNSVSKTATYILLGAEPAEITIDKNLLTFFMNIARNKGSVEYQIIDRQIVFADAQHSTFTNKVIATLRKYNLGDIKSYIENPIPKLHWKKQLKKKQINTGQIYVVRINRKKAPYRF